MTIPNFQKLMLPFLKELANGKEHSMEEITDTLAKQFQLDARERNERIPSGPKKLENRIGWARTYLKKAGLIESHRLGKVTITAYGTKALRSNPPSINIKYLFQFPSFSEWKGVKPKDPDEKEQDDIGQTPEEIIDSSYRKYKEKFASDLLDQIKACSPQFFEDLVIDLLVEMGYGGSKEDAEAVGRSGDGGIDGVIKQDKLGLDVIYIQAKRWDNNIPGDKIRSFAATLDLTKTTNGVFTTTSAFTDEATKQAELMGKKIVLIDGEQLAQYMMDLGLGVAERTDYPVWKRIDMDYFQE